MRTGNRMCNPQCISPGRRRLVRPGGCFMLVTYGEPESRLLHLVRPELRWRVQVRRGRRHEPCQIGSDDALSHTLAAWHGGAVTGSCVALGLGRRGQANA